MLELHEDNGQENGNYYIMVGVRVTDFPGAKHSHGLEDFRTVALCKSTNPRESKNNQPKRNSLVEPFN